MKDKPSHAIQVALFSEILKDQTWADSAFRNDVHRFMRTELDFQAKRKAILPAGEVWEMKDGSYIKKPNGNGFSLSNRQQFEGKGEQP